MVNKLFNYFTLTEKILWGVSVLLIISFPLVFGQGGYLNSILSLIGVTAIVFGAKANPLGPFLMIIFSIIYGIVSFSFAYYGEMFTYLGMTMPMSIIALISWLKNPFKGKKYEVKINHIKTSDVIEIIVLTIVITATCYFILAFLNTANLIPSTVSVATSFTAVFLQYKRSPYFSVAYAVNDVVLIVLWILATMQNILYLSVAVCFAVFFINDIYAFLNWKKIRKRQALDNS